MANFVIPETDYNIPFHEIDSTIIDLLTFYENLTDNESFVFNTNDNPLIIENDKIMELINQLKLFKIEYRCND